MKKKIITDEGGFVGNDYSDREDVKESLKKMENISGNGWDSNTINEIRDTEEEFGRVVLRTTNR